MAVYALGQIGDRRAVEPLIENLSFDDGEFKEMVIYSLGEIGGKTATNYLNLALEYDDPNIR
jgi:HEAT repeat protein